MYVMLFIGVVFAIAYLAAKKTWCDQLSYACNEVGWLFTSAVLITGSIWAKPIWGAWWSWDARLTTTLLIWLIYTAYLILRSQRALQPKMRSFSAMVAIFGFLDIPLIHYS